MEQTDNLRFVTSKYQYLGRDILLKRFDPQFQTRVDTEWLSVDETGFKVWPLSEQFCELVSQGWRDINFESKTIVELGSGAGLCGLFLSSFAKMILAY